MNKQDVLNDFVLKNQYDAQKNDEKRKLSPNEKEVEITLDSELEDILVLAAMPRLHKLYQKCE